MTIAEQDKGFMARAATKVADLVSAPFLLASVGQSVQGGPIEGKPYILKRVNLTKGTVYLASEKQEVVMGHASQIRGLDTP